MKQLKERSVTALLILVILSGCGGGGSSSGTSGPVTSALSFPVKNAYSLAYANGIAKNFTVSGDCGGTGNMTNAPATTPATFEGVMGFSAVSTVTFTLTKCSVNSIATSGVDYYDTNYNPLGSIGSDYSVNATIPALPLSAKVGGTGLVVRTDNFTDSTKAFTTGYDIVSYTVLADTANTVLVNLITNSYDALGVKTSTEQDISRVSPTGASVPVSVDIQIYSPSVLHLVGTFN